MKNNQRPLFETPGESIGLFDLRDKKSARESARLRHKILMRFSKEYRQRYNTRNPVLICASEQGLLVGWDDKAARAFVARADCDSWNCEECAARMASRWRLRAEMGTRALLGAGYRVDFVTITSHERLKDFAATEAVWRNAWSKLYAALKRNQPSLEYMIVPEKHKDGRMHVHAVWNAGVSQKWLKDNARKRGLGYQAKVIKIQDAAPAVRYITKYIGKDLGENVPAHFGACVFRAGGLIWQHQTTRAQISGGNTSAVMARLT